MIKIKPIKTVIHANNVLNLMGKDFNFDHAKGIAELLKNSIDAYNVNNVPDKNQIIIISVKTSRNDYIKEIKVVDFCGLSKEKIDKGFTYWFSNIAASLTQDGSKSKTKTLGGHGNGGKFYMRQMFKKSFLYTYLRGKLNIFGFNKEKQYGYLGKYCDYRLSPEKAMEISELKELNLPDNIINKIILSEIGFTVIKGISPVKAKGTNYRIKLAEKIINNPQARRLIVRKQIYFQTYPNINWYKLSVPSISPKPGFEEPVIYYCPSVMNVADKKVNMISKNYINPIKLTLYTSAKPLTGIKYHEINRVDFIGELGVIASYNISELGLFSSAFTEFVYGECNCQIMENPNEDYVKNDRLSFVKGDRSEILLDWVKSCIQELAKKMENKTTKEKRQNNLKNTANFNKILNTWNKQFLNAIFKKELFGNDNDSGFKGTDEPNPVIGQNQRTRKNKKKERKTGTRGGDDAKKTLSHPSVLISGYDTDPLSSDGNTFDCDPRHPVVYQRPIDVRASIYWINTSKSLARLILSKESADSPRWRHYLFQRHLDIIIKEYIFQIGKKEINLDGDEINQKIDEITSDVHDKASADLLDFLFENNYKL